jgi:hypothetical protein
MTRRIIALPVAVAATAVTCALVLWPGAGAATSRTQTLRAYDKPVSIKVTHADGSVVTHAPYPEVKPGDTLDVNSLVYRGDHAHHPKHWTGSGHLRCEFGSAGPPSCESHVAIGGAILIFTGNPGKLSNGTGIYQGATGRVISSKDVPGEDNASDIVAKIKLHG